MLRYRVMTPIQAISFFEGRAGLASVCKVTETAVHYWVRQGFIPYDKQCLIQVEAERLPRRKSKGRLQASWHDIPAEKRPAA